MRWLKGTLIVLAISLLIVPLPRPFVERWYARGVYPHLQPVLTRLSNTTALAWFDVVIAAGVLALVIAIGVTIRHRQRGLLAAFLRSGVNVLAALSVGYLWFLVVWGLNYQREPMTSRLDFDQRRITREALQGLAGRTVTSLNTLHATAHRAGWDGQPAGVMDDAWRRVEEDVRLTWRIEQAVPKKTLLNFYFARVSVDGMTAPFFLETLVNQDLLPFERPATIAHEWAHLAGFADESEASFVGWLACLRGPAPVEYSGWLALYATVVQALPEAERARVAQQLDRGPASDLRAIAERIQRRRVPAASRAGYAAYDKFLKANRVDAGVGSYAQVLRLILGTAFDRRGTPVLVQ